LYTPNKNITLNWSTFIGSEDPDSTRRMRYFNDVYGIFQLNENWQLTTGFDIGYQQKAKNSSDYDTWMTLVIIFRYDINKKWAVALREEYFGDESEIIVSTISPDGFQTTGLSLNVDYSPNKNVLCRIEGRYLKDQNNIFETKSGLASDDFFVTASVAISINRK